MQLRAAEREAQDRVFVTREHFQAEFQAILRDSLPDKVIKEELGDHRAPKVAGVPLPKGGRPVAATLFKTTICERTADICGLACAGAVTQLFPMTFDGAGILPHPSNTVCMYGDALLAVVNSPEHIALLKCQDMPSKQLRPDYVAWASLEVENPVLDAEGLLVGGNFVLTCPDTFYPTIWCRKSMRVKGVAYPARSQASRQAPAQQVGIPICIFLEKWFMCCLPSGWWSPWC